MEFSISCSFWLKNWEEWEKFHRVVHLKFYFTQDVSQRTLITAHFCFQYDNPKMFSKLTFLLTITCFYYIAYHFNNFRKAYNFFRRRSHTYLLYEYTYACAYILLYTYAIPRRVLTTLLVSEALDPLTILWVITNLIWNFNAYRLHFPSTFFLL